MGDEPIYGFVWYFSAEASAEARKLAIEYVTREMDDRDYLFWEFQYIRRYRHPLDYFSVGYRLKVRYQEKPISNLSGEC